MDNLFLPGVSAARLREILEKAGGNEIASGKFASPQSSAALAANGFGWFLDRPGSLPAFPGLHDLDWPATRIDVERQMRFPWRGGRHPWLDAAVETANHLIGVESKRFEPFRVSKPAALSAAYDRDVWGEGMTPFLAMRDGLRAMPGRFRHLDGAQLVKHAFGLATEACRLGKNPVLLYIFAEPADVPAVRLRAHRAEIATFEAEVSGAKVRFGACSWREWISTWTGDAAAHGIALRETFAP